MGQKNPAKPQHFDLAQCTKKELNFTTKFFVHLVAVGYEKNYCSLNLKGTVTVDS